LEVELVSFFYNNPNRQQILEDMRFLLKRPEGRRALRRIFNQTNLMGLSKALNALDTAFNEGARSAGRALAELIEQAAPGEMGRLLMESSLEFQAQNNQKEDEDNG
jgi:hypothetical protein